MLSAGRGVRRTCPPAHRWASGHCETLGLRLHDRVPVCLRRRSTEDGRVRVWASVHATVFPTCHFCLHRSRRPTSVCRGVHCAEPGCIHHEPRPAAPSAVLAIVEGPVTMPSRASTPSRAAPRPAARSAATWPGSYLLCHDDGNSSAPAAVTAPARPGELDATDRNCPMRRLAWSSSVASAKREVGRGERSRPS
jgi:hypothetical protein